MQTPVPGRAQISVERANFRADCSQSADVMATLLEGAEVEILESHGDWYRVRHAATGVEGCLHHSVLGPVTPLAEAEPEDELGEATEPATEEGEAAEREAVERETVEGEAAPGAEQEGREAEPVVREATREASPVETDPAADSAASAERFTGYLDFNVGFTTPEQDGLSTRGAATQGSPPTPVAGSRVESAYEYARDRTLGVGGGFLRTLASGGRVGAGASLTHTNYPAGVGLFVSRPHGSLPNVIVADSAVALTPDREETALHLHVVFVTPSAARWQVRVFAGPSVFRSELPVWTRIVARFPVDPPRMEIQRVELGTQEETVVGGHVGGDLAYFFSDRFGVGTSVLYSRATGEVSVPALDPEESNTSDITLGGLAAMLGVRLRF